MKLEDEINFIKAALDLLQKNYVTQARALLIEYLEYLQEKG